LKKINKISLKVLISISFLLIFSSCYTTKTTSYVQEKNYAIFEMKGDNTENNFTHEKNGLKLTYDFWGENLIVVLENISDKTIFVDINKSYITTGKEKVNYNSMIAGDFTVLPIEPGKKIEVNDFLIINSDNETRIKEKIKIAKQFSDASLSFKTSDYPIKLENKIVFGSKSSSYSEFLMNDNFYAEKVNIINPTDFNHINQYGKLYNKTYFQTSITTEKESINLEPIMSPAQMAELFVYVVYFALIFAQ